MNSLNKSIPGEITSDKSTLDDLTQEISARGSSAKGKSKPASWIVPKVSTPFQSTVVLPGSKSLTNRALILAAIAAQPTRIIGALMARDTESMIGAITALGASVERSSSALNEIELLVTPCTASQSARTINCDQAGTVMRFVPLLAAVLPGKTRFEIASSAAHRPQEQTITTLRQLGIKVEEHSKTGHMPFTVYGNPELRGGAITIDSTSSSQFVSAVLLTGARMKEGVEVTLTGPAPSLPHIQMTINCLRKCGVNVTAGTDPSKPSWYVHPGQVGGGVTHIEPDLTNAGPFMAAAAFAHPDAAGSRVTFPYWPEQTTQAGDYWCHIFTEMGAVITRNGNELSIAYVPPADRRSVTLDMTDYGELAPCVASIAPALNGTTTITGIGHLRGHETDRLDALSRELEKCGVSVESGEDWLRITAGELHGADLNSYDDHRMIMFAAVIGACCAQGQITVNNPNTVDKTYPSFCQYWQNIVRG